MNTMNTEDEYSLMKAVLANLKEKYKTDTIYARNQYRHAIKQVKKRMFILNLNMRPQLPLPVELVDKINHTALFDELKEIKPKEYYWTHTKSGWGREYDLRHNGLLNILSSFNTPCSKVQCIKWTDGDRYTPHDKQNGYIYKKDLLHNILDANRTPYKKTWNIKRLLKEVMSL